MGATASCPCVVNDAEPAMGETWVNLFDPDDPPAGVPGAETLRSLVAVDHACFPEPAHRTLAALQHSPQLRRTTKLVVGWVCPGGTTPDSTDARGGGDDRAEEPSREPPRPVGFVAYVAGSMEVSIVKVAVVPAVRRRGVGEAMVRAVLAAAKERRAKVIRLRVETTGAAAVGLYRKVGFQEEKEKPPSRDFYGPGRHALHLALHL